jgi:NhaA family Na+:H+ antiporter
VVNAVDLMDPTPTPWYKREFDIHTALDKGLGSILLLAATAASLMLANSMFSGGFIGFWEHFHIGPKALGLHLNAHEWVNEGLMALFFFNVGLEIKREFVYGSLSNFRAALLPCVGALGGMIFPMGVYLALNSVAGGVPAGWAIPMATDIAFAMGVYNFFKNRMPPAVATFLLTLATVDDLGAIAVIAVCFAKGIVPMYLGVSAALCGVMALACKKGVTNMVVHTAMGVALWFALLKGGINADIAGVISALAIPAGASAPEGTHAHKMDVDSEKVTLLDHLIHVMHPLSSLLIMPLFALANCAVPVNASALGGVMTTPVGLGIMAGLMIGKPVGIAGLCWLSTKVGMCSFPAGMNFKHLVTVGMLAGIGFTMSLFLIEQALVGMPAISATAKLAILCSSGLAATIGGFAMSRFPVYMCEIVCDEDSCRPELMEEQVFKAENDCDEVACEPKEFKEEVSAVTGEADKKKKD